MANKYFAMIEGEQRGPYTLQELSDAGVTPDTYIWCKGMTDWQKARDNADVCRAFRQRIFDMMHPSQRPQEPEKTDSDAQADDRNLDSIPPVFRRYFIKNPELKIGEPTNTEPDYSRQPRSLLPEAILVTLLCCPATGFVAIYFAVRTTKMWKEGKQEEAYDLNRKARMWIGITFFLGLILNAVVARYFAA